MMTVRFNTTIGNDHVIRPPAGVNITPGAAEVIVVQNDSVAAAPANKGLGFRERLASAAEE